MRVWCQIWSFRRGWAVVNAVLNNALIQGSARTRTIFDRVINFTLEILHVVLDPILRTLHVILNDLRKKS